MLSADYWEWIGVATALIYVILASAGKRTCFLFGLISSLIYVDLLFAQKLRFEMAINVYYAIMSVAGWINWAKDKDHLHPKMMKKKEFVSITIVGLLVSVLLGFITYKFTDWSMTYVDSFTTTMAVIATWMMIKKYVQNWLIWIVADGVSIGMYYYKDLQPTALLFAIYTVVAVFGFYNWKKLMRE